MKKKLFLSGMLLVLVACTTPVKKPEPVVAPVEAPKMVTPDYSEDAKVARDLAAKWQQANLSAVVQYRNQPGMMEFRSLLIPVPANAKQAAEVVRSVAAFAARANTPVRILLNCRTNTEDKRLSQEIKQGAVQSGGRNSVVLEHDINAVKPRQILVEIREKNG